MRKYIFLISLVSILAACNNTSSSETKSELHSIADLSANAAKLDGQNVTFQGMVVHVCKHGGQKMFVTDTSEDNSVLVFVGSSIPEFDVALEGSQVEISGKIILTPSETMNNEEESKLVEGVENSSDGMKEECVTEVEHDKKNAVQNVIQYHVEATSYKELQN